MRRMVSNRRDYDAPVYLTVSLHLQAQTATVIVTVTAFDSGHAQHLRVFFASKSILKQNSLQRFGRERNFFVCWLRFSESRKGNCCLKLIETDFGS